MVISDRIELSIKNLEMDELEKLKIKLTLKFDENSVKSFDASFLSW